MPYRFTKGTSAKTTVETVQHGGTPSHKSNTMKGMPGSVRSGQDASNAGLVGMKGVGPKREGPVGSRTGNTVSRLDKASARGSSDKSYRATSTGRAGTISRGKMESLKGRAKFSSER